MKENCRCSGEKLIQVTQFIKPNASFNWPFLSHNNIYQGRKGMECFYSRKYKRGTFLVNST